MSSRRFNESELSTVKAWQLPSVEDENAAELALKTNAINKTSQWKFEPPEEVEEIKPPTAEEIEAIRQSAYDEGFAEGKENGFAEGREEGLAKGHEEGIELGKQEGLEQGLASGQEQIDNLARHWQAQLDALHDPLQQVDQQVREQLTKLTVSLAKAVIRKEVTTSHEVIVQALAEGMKALPLQENTYQIHLHPLDIQRINAHYGADYIAQQGWQLVESPAMQEGGCDIITANNAVDVSIERRSRQTLDKFLAQQGLSDD